MSSGGGVKMWIETSELNKSLFKPKRNWNGDSSSKARSRKWKDYPYIEVLTVPSCTLKYLKRKNQKSMFAMLVHKPFTSGKFLWVLSQTNSVFYPSIPTTYTAKHLYLTFSVHAKNQRTWEFIMEAVWELSAEKKLSFMFVVVTFRFFIYVFVLL